MIIIETIERECCDPKKDFKPVGMIHYKNCSFCVHCGQWWIETLVGMRSTPPSVKEWKKVFIEI